MMAMPYDPHINWKITQLNPVFDNEEDEVAHLGFRRRFDNAMTFRDHPVRYMPNKGDKNLYRTVMIDFIPAGTDIRDILQQVRGGPLESIQSFKPIGRSNDFMTARIVFNYELDAQALYKYGQNPGIEIAGKRVRVWQVLEPTYPKHAQLEKDIFEEGFTRLLLMGNVSAELYLKIQLKLADQVRAGFVVDFSVSHDGLQVVEFTSVEECAKAMRRLISDPDCASVRFDFKEDPCETR